MEIFTSTETIVRLAVVIIDRFNCKTKTLFSSNNSTWNKHGIEVVT